uniref:Minor histocompatibility antigen H13 n=3 Tax=Lygus hesperus TaxID=30085 RepID=A0A0A9W5J7_LYGHE
MAANDPVENIVDSLNNTDVPVNENIKIPATPEGMAVAYASLVIMALFPIALGSVRSVKHHKEMKQQHKKSGEKPDTMTQKDAAMFPFMASMALFALYIFFKIFSKEYINLLLTGYFFVLGVLALCHLASPIISSLVPATIPNIPFHLIFVSNHNNHLIDYEFTTYDMVCLVCCSLVGIWYVYEKHWVVNNLFGIAFAISGVEMLHLNNVVTGCILLCGLFVYDIFWVFGTNVMVTVAKSFEAPIKLVFPQDLLEHGLKANNFAMLGLGDIVIPGIFIALLLRFDNSRKKNSKFYFYATFVAYFVGLLTTIFVMHVFKHAQPALLYLVPACLGTPLFLALIRGDISTMFQYEDHPSDDDKKKTNNKSPKAKKVKGT